MQRLRAAILLLVAACGLYLSIPAEGLGAVVAAASSAWAPALVGAAALLVGIIGARMARFQLLLTDARPSWSEQVVASGIGFFALQLLPFRLGEFVRPFLLSAAGVPWGRSLGALAVERLLDLLALGSLVGICGLVELPGVLVIGGIDVLVAAQRTIGGVVALGLVIVLLVLVVGSPAVERLERLPGVGPPLSRLLGHAVTGLTATRPRVALGAAALTAWVWASNTAIVGLLLHGFPDLPTGAAPAVLTTTATTAGILAVPTPGMVGSFELFATQSMGLWQPPEGSAAAMALFWHALTLLLHALLGAALLFQQGMSLGDIVRASRAPRQESP